MSPGPHGEINFFSQYFEDMALIFIGWCFRGQRLEILDVVWFLRSKIVYKAIIQTVKCHLGRVVYTGLGEDIFRPFAHEFVPE